MDSVFLREQESEEQVFPLAVILERRHKMTLATIVPRMGTGFAPFAKRAANFIHQQGHRRDTLRCEKEPAIEALARESAQARQDGTQ